MDTNQEHPDKVQVDAGIPNKVYISPISWGLGDLIISFPIIQALIDSGRNTHLVLHADFQTGLAERMNGLCSILTEEQLLGQALPDDAVYLSLRRHPLQTELWWGSPEYYQKYPDLLINDLLRIIGSDYGINARFDRLTPLRSENKPQFKDTVVFVPGSDGIQKCWSAENWVKLKVLLNKAGLKTVMLGQPDNSALVNSLLQDIEWIPTKRLPEALDILSSAAGTVAVDTGLMHLSVHQGTPTVALFRPRPVYWRPYEYCAKLEAPRDCDPQCYEAHLSASNHKVVSFAGYEGKTWRCARPSDQSCMAEIKVGDVFEATLRLVEMHAKSSANSRWGDS